MSYNPLMCPNTYFLLNGYNSRGLNTTTLESIMYDWPMFEGVSVKEMLHLGYWARNGRFPKCCHGSNDYNLRRVTTPLVIFSTPYDMMSTYLDVRELTRSLGGIP
ncbi:hypothetical protein ILUMI_17134 [Ignelater luminosus]|uniref:Uncharacterized protein n=1 Tax=Ignelater luminosus TaxID=2038154 RepID=A0A8K0CM98_IGNLU|nr:hypothetical protein ILUMI_17134 [Ignelater luminosus]